MLLALLPPVAIGQHSPSRKDDAVAKPSTQTSGHRETERQAVIDQYRAMSRAMVAADVAALDNKLAPGYTLTHITGYRQSRAEWLAQVKSGHMRYLKTEEEGLEVHVEGDSATLSGRSLVTANIWGTQGTWRLQQRIRMRKVKRVWLMEESVATTY